MKSNTNHDEIDKISKNHETNLRNSANDIKITIKRNHKKSVSSNKTNNDNNNNDNINKNTTTNNNNNNIQISYTNFIRPMKQSIQLSIKH